MLASRRVPLKKIFHNAFVGWTVHMENTFTELCSFSVLFYFSLHKISLLTYDFFFYRHVLDYASPFLYLLSASFEYSLLCLTGLLIWVIASHLSAYAYLAGKVWSFKPCIFAPHWQIYKQEQRYLSFQEDYISAFQYRLTLWSLFLFSLPPHQPCVLAELSSFSILLWKSCLYV